VRTEAELPMFNSGALSSDLLSFPLPPSLSGIPLLLRSGNPVKAPRWVNFKQPQDTPPVQEEEESIEHDEPIEKSKSLSSSPIGVESSSASNPSLNPPPPSTPGLIAKQSVPEIYPQVLTLPIARRLPFTEFYKSLVNLNPGVVAAQKEVMKVVSHI
jgi:Lon-like ATP-dependent protease